MPDLSIFGLKFENIFVIIEINILETVWLQNFVQEQKMPIFVTKNALFAYFLSGIWNRYCYIWNQHPRFFLKVKFRAKIKVFKSRVKNALFGCYKQHLRVFIQALKWDKFEVVHFKYDNSFSTLLRKHPNKTFLITNLRMFIFCAKLYLMKKFEGVGFKYDNGFLKFQPKYIQIKQFFVLNLNLFIFAWNFVYRKIQGHFSQTWK